MLIDGVNRPSGCTAEAPQSVFDSWNPRHTQIFPAEAFAVYAAVWHHREQLQGQDLIAFVDNEGAAAALIRGSSAVDDVGCMRQALHWLLLGIICRIWIEWIDSDSNPSDGLLRDGLADPWTIEQNWELSVGSLPPWQSDLGQHWRICSETLGLV